jgi:hypothetical protein
MTAPSTLEPGTLESDAAILIRSSRPGDAPRLERLAQLDSARVPAGPFMVAEQESRLVAAVTADGETIADPFRRTAEVVEMLKLRAAEGIATRRSEPVRRRFSGGLRLRLAP